MIPLPVAAGVLGVDIGRQLRRRRRRTFVREADRVGNVLFDFVVDALSIRFVDDGCVSGELVLEDLRNGYVTDEVARTVYGL